MVKDRRYKTLKTLLEGGNIQRFSDMLEIVPVSTIRGDLKANYLSIKRKMEQPEKFALEDIFILAELIDCDYQLLIQLARKEYSRLKRGKKRKD